MDWFVFAIIAVLFGSVAGIFQKLLLSDKKINEFTSVILFELLGAVLIGIFAFSQGFSMPPVEKYPLNFLIMTVLYGFGVVFLFKAFQLCEVSEISILGSARALWTILIALLFLGETLTILKVAGTVCILISITFLNFKKGKISFTKGYVYAMLFAFCFGAAVANDRYILSQPGMNAISYSALAFLFPGLGILAFNVSSLKHVRPLLKTSSLIVFLVMTVFWVVSALAFYVSFEKGAKASQLGPITISQVIVTVILAALFLNERDHLFKKIIAATLVTIGVVLLR